MAFVDTQTIPGASVYGVNQVTYAVGGKTGCDYSALVAAATLQQVAAFEAECNALSAMVKVRMRKLNELGEALATLANVMTRMNSVKNQKPGDTVSNSALTSVKATMERYGLSIILDNETIRRDNASFAQNDVQFAIDREDNNLQQDMVTVQSAFSKRDNAFSTASRLVKKTLNSSRSIIGSFGG